MTVTALEAAPDRVADALGTRLDELRVEQAKGRRRMLELDAEREELRDTLLRIAGALQVLEELRGPREDERME
jgi:hypothetical protein